MKKLIIQNHHLIYPVAKKQQEETVKIYKGEHWALTQLQRRRNISQGFLKSLRLFILLNEDRAVEL